MYSDWSVLAELLLGFVHLSNEINEALSGFWHPLFRPVGELELADCSGLAVLGDQREREQVFRGTEETRHCASAFSDAAATLKLGLFPLFLHFGQSSECSFPPLLSFFTDTHIYVWMELEHCGAEGPLMTVKFIYSPLKVLHHRELQCWPSGTGGCAFHVSQSS